MLSRSDFFFRPVSPPYPPSSALPCARVVLVGLRAHRRLPFSRFLRRKNIVSRLVVAGFDAHADDPLAGIALDAEDYGWVTREICAVATRVRTFFGP